MDLIWKETLDVVGDLRGDLLYFGLLSALITSVLIYFVVRCYRPAGKRVRIAIWLFVLLAAPANLSVVIAEVPFTDADVRKLLLDKSQPRSPSAETWDAADAEMRKLASSQEWWDVGRLVSVGIFDGGDRATLETALTSDLDRTVRRYQIFTTLYLLLTLIPMDALILLGLTKLVVWVNGRGVTSSK